MILLFPQMIIILQYLYSGLESYKEYRDADGLRSCLSEQVCFQVIFKSVHSVTRSIVASLTKMVRRYWSKFSHVPCDIIQCNSASM